MAAAGVGKVRPRRTATLLVERLGCRALVLSGVAGGLDDALAIGDIVIADRIVDIDYGRLTDERTHRLPARHVAGTGGQTRSGLPTAGGARSSRAQASV